MRWRGAPSMAMPGRAVLSSVGRDDPARQRTSLLVGAALVAARADSKRPQGRFKTTQTLWRPVCTHQNATTIKFCRVTIARRARWARRWSRHATTKPASNYNRCLPPIENRTAARTYPGVQGAANRATSVARAAPWSFFPSPFFEKKGDPPEGLRPRQGAIPPRPPPSAPAWR